MCSKWLSEKLFGGTFSLSLPFSITLATDYQLSRCSSSTLVVRLYDRQIERKKNRFTILFTHRTISSCWLTYILFYDFRSFSFWRASIVAWVSLAQSSIEFTACLVKYLFSSLLTLQKRYAILIKHFCFSSILKAYQLSKKKCANNLDGALLLYN